MSENIYERLSRLERELKEIMATVPRDKSGKWFPRPGEEFYFITAYGEICHDSYHSPDILNQIEQINNAFQTVEEANFMLECMKVRTELNNMADGSIDDEDGFYIMVYSFDKKAIVPVKSGGIFSYGDIPIFKNEASVITCIDEIGEERLLKYYFTIER